MSLLQEKFYSLKDITDEGVKNISTGDFSTYSEIFIESEKYLDILSKYNSEIVSVVLPNSIVYFEVLIACILTGNIFNPIPYFTSDEELERIFKYVDSKLLITDRKILSNVNKSQLRIDPKKIKLEYQQLNIYSDLSLSEGSQIASLYYSSGTTGNPKGVLYSHDNIFHLIESIIRGFKFSKKSKHLSLLPFGHTASINYNILPCLFAKSSMVIAEGFSDISNKFFKVLSEEDIHYTQLVPTIVYLLLKINYKLEDLEFKNLIFIGCGSSFLPKDIQEKFEKKFGIKLANLYGLSETGPSHIDDPRSKNWEPGSIGINLDVNECKISKDSEILIKGKNVFCGYYKNENLYKKTVIDGWFHTGDLGAYENKKFFFKDRSKDLIIKGGINIIPAEIEEIIYKNSLVLEVVVVGLKDNVQGEEIFAAISLKNKNIDKKDLKIQIYEKLSKYLSSYKHPKKIFFLESIPKTLSGKLKRREVRKILENEHYR